MATLPDVLSPTMAALLACAEAAVIEGERPVSKAFLNPGLTVPFDDCCEGGGQLWVSVAQVYPSRSFPQPDQTAASCNPMFYVAQLRVGIIRCAATVDSNGVFPTGAQMTADALGMTADMALLETAIRCCWEPPMEKFILERWVPLEDAGGCVGGEWSVFVTLPSCACPADPPMPPA